MLPSIWANKPAFYNVDYPEAKLYLVHPVFHLTKLMTQVKRIEAPWSIARRFTGVNCLWLLLRVLKTLLTRLVLIYLGSIRISSSLKVIEFISSLAIVQLGATHPLKIQTIFKTFSTRRLGLTCFLRFIICYLVNYLIETSVILTAYWNSSSVSSTSRSSSSSLLPSAALSILFRPWVPPRVPAPPAIPNCFVK